jgi:hypothetical protein
MPAANGRPAYSLVASPGVNLARMTPEPIGGGAPPERRQAVWPWLLMPLAVLAIFFALLRLRETAPVPEAPPANVASDPVSSD